MDCVELTTTKNEETKIQELRAKILLFWRKTFHMSLPQNQELTGKIPNLKSISNPSTILCNLKKIKLKIFAQTLIDIRL